MLNLRLSLSALVLALSWGLAQAYLDGREVLSLLNASRYQEAFALAERFPERYAQWGASIIRNALPPVAHTYSLPEAAVRSAEYACRYASVNAESEAYCYYALLVLLRQRDFDPRVATLMAKASLPPLSQAEARERMAALAEKGVPFAVYDGLGRDEKGLRELAEKYPYSLGGALAAGRLSLILWEREQYQEAVTWALRASGATGTAAGVLAYGEYHGIGVKQNQEAACSRALFWAKRTMAGPAVYTLGLCYRDGAGGFPKDPVLAYGVFWVGKDYSRYPRFEERVKELEGLLTTNQLKEGRARAAEHLLQ